MIKVRLPPKEISRREPPPPPFEGARSNRVPGSLPPQSQRGESVPAPQSSHQAKRPVRLTNQESLLADEKPEIAEEVPPPPAHAGRRAQPPADRSTPVEEISTMVLPGWREELEQLRKRQTAASPPAVPQSQQFSPPVSHVASRPAERNTPLPTFQEPEEQEASVGEVFADSMYNDPTEQNNQTDETFASDPDRPELRVKVWEQEPTIYEPQAQAKVEAGPAPVVEHSPLAPAFSAGEETEQVVESADIGWQALSVPVIQPDSGPAVEERARQEDEVRQEQEESGVEDLPTVPLAVPEEAKQQPAITIERSSTPAPRKRPSTQEEVEDLPTRPMPASPRSPFPPSAPQPLQSREREQRDARPAPISMVPNPPSSPGVYWPGPPPGNASQAQGLPPGPPAARGRVPGPNSQPGQVFNPAGRSAPPQGPLSSPGNTAFRPPAAQQRPPAFAPPTPAPAAPRPTEAGAEPARPPRKRIKPLRVALLIALILAVGAGAFIFYYQSSSGGAIAQPYQTFQNSTLGVFLNYPQGWTSTLSQAQTSVHFADSSQTGQVTLSMATPNAQSLTQYVDQETTQLGITSPQLEPTIMFGGTSWQQVQGNVVQKGVTYMLDLYVTQHGVHVYTLIFMAPPPVYARMERESFAPLRASFRFIGQ